jgi:putative spermidine/putrescine transport system permease protein
MRNGYRTELVQNSTFSGEAYEGHLARKLARLKRASGLRRMALVLPLLLLTLGGFIYPVWLVVWRSVDNPVIAEAFPRTLSKLSTWDGRAVPDDESFDALGEELIVARVNGSLGRVAARLNYVYPGSNTLLPRTAAALSTTGSLPYRRVFVESDPRWSTPDVWARLKQTGERYTIANFLAAVDLDRDPEGNVVRASAMQRIYVPLFIRTLAISICVTSFCLLLGYPFAFYMATRPPNVANLLLFIVLIPFWTSLLVRITAWIVLLQRKGVVNDLIVIGGLIPEANRPQLIYNSTGTMIVMTHVLLPFMILPIYSVMKGISPAYVRASLSLGATPFQSFRRIYFPMTLPGIGAGSILVFISAIGYYVTPALVGGQSGQLISNLIAYHMQKSLNWGLASALATILLAFVMLLYWVYDRLIGIDKLSFN